MAAAVETLPPVRFYGRDLPRPRLYSEVKFSSQRVDAPLPVNEALLDWASKASWNMGGLDPAKQRQVGRVEGNVLKLRKMVRLERAKKERKERKSRKGASRRKREREWEESDEEEEDEEEEQEEEEALLKKLDREEIEDGDEEVEEADEEEDVEGDDVQEVEEFSTGRVDGELAAEQVDEISKRSKKGKSNTKSPPALQMEAVPLSPLVVLGDDVGEDILLKLGVDNSPASILSPSKPVSRKPPRGSLKAGSKKNSSSSKKGEVSPDSELVVTPADGVLSVPRPSSKATPLMGRGGSIGKTPVTSRRNVSPAAQDDTPAAAGAASRIQPRRLQSRLDAAAEGVGSTGEAGNALASVRITRSTAGSPSRQRGVEGSARSVNRVRRRLV